MTTSESTTRLQDYIKELLPWAHGHQLKSIATFVAAILEKQTGNQAELARTQGNQEAAVKRLSRLIHNERLNPRDFPEWLCRKALERLPRTGKVRIAIDWTTEDDQHLLVVSLVIGRRAMPIFWRAYEQSVLKGRMKRYELAVIKRAFKLIFQYVNPSRIRLTADRGFPDDDLFALLDDLKVTHHSRQRLSQSPLSRSMDQTQYAPVRRERAAAQPRANGILSENSAQALGDNESRSR
jgi:hypothetical protein